MSDDQAPATADPEPGPETPPADPGTPPVDTPETDPAAPPAGAPAGVKPVESFINPADLPEEIKPHWKRMHAAYTRWIEKERNPARQDLELLAKFRTDENFARELVRAEAQRLGLHLAPANGATTPSASAPTSSEVPSRVIEAVKARLDPSLHWMAEAMAASQWAAAQEAARPLVEKDRAKDHAAREAEWGALSSKLTESAPGWEAHEAEMTELHDWLKSPAMTHPRYGDKLSFLYNAVTNGAAAKVAAIRAMGDAARSATRTGQSGRSTLPNTTDRVRKATSPRDAMRIAAEEAERELRAAGVAVPD